MLDADVQQKVDQAFECRLKALSAIYKHQGDTQFYRKMLSGNAGIYSQILGCSSSDFAVTHEHVLAFVGQAPVEDEIALSEDSSQPKIESNTTDSDDDEWTEVEEVEVEQSRELQGKIFHLGRKYLISVDEMDAESLREMRKTPDFDAKLGVGKVVTATGWDLRYSFYPQVECVHIDGTKQVFSPTCLKEIES